MPLSDLPLSVLFLFFLLLFLLLGLYPAWKRTLAKIHGLLKAGTRSEGAADGRFKSERTSTTARMQMSAQLDSYEIIVLSRLTRNGAKGLSRKQIAADLHLEARNVKRALQSLHNRGLILVAVTPLLSIRFYLSERGHVYALAQDLIPNIQKSKECR